MGSFCGKIEEEAHLGCTEGFPSGDLERGASSEVVWVLA